VEAIVKYLRFTEIHWVGMIQGGLGYQKSGIPGNFKSIASHNNVEEAQKVLRFGDQRL
jgi:hypothetical protein